jgi:CRISPR/Cas system CSM-associated protein Csm4 (group 5 of RAMP superfamily)
MSFFSSKIKKMPQNSNYFGHDMKIIKTTCEATSRKLSAKWKIEYQQKISQTFSDDTLRLFKFSLFCESHKNWFLIDINEEQCSSENEIEKWLKLNFISTTYYYHRTNQAIFCDQKHAQHCSNYFGADL